MRLPRALSIWVIKTSKDKGCTASLGSLYSCLTVLRLKTFLKCSLNPSSSHVCLLSLTHPPWASLMSLLLFSGPPRVYQHLLLLWVPSKSSLSPGWTSPSPSTSCYRTSAPVPTILVAFHPHCDSSAIYKDTGEESVKNSAKWNL